MTRDRTALLAALPVAAVAVFAGIVSYSHIFALAVRTGQSGTAARLLPLSVDLLIVAGSVILLAEGGNSRLGWLGVGPGVVATLFANVESGLPHGPLGATVAAWPAVAFSVATFMVERWLKSRAGVLPAAAPGTVPAPVPTDAGNAALMALEATLAAGNPLSQNQLMERFGLTRAQAAKVRQAVTAGANGQHAGAGTAGQDSGADGT